MARITLSELIETLRGMTHAGPDDYQINNVDYWSDDQIQRVLDRHRRDVFREQLQPIESMAGGGIVEYREYRSQYTNFERTDGGTALFFIEDTIVGPSITNKITNPVFGHSTYNTGWGAGADLVMEKNTDIKHVLWESVSARVTRIGTGSNYKLTQVINVGNTNTHQLMAYVKKLDGTAVTAADVRLFYDVNLTTTYTPCGGGWYQLTASVTGINSSISSGVAILTMNTPMFVAGVQLAESPTVVPFIYGDMLGCAWTGTPHESTSTSVAGYVRIPTAGILSAGGGTALFFIEDSLGNKAGTATYSVDYLNGRITFSADQAGKVYYLTGRSYDLNAAAADIWRQKAGHYAVAVNFSTDNHRIDRGEIIKNCERMASYYEQQAGPTTIRFDRDDMVGGGWTK